MLVYFIWKLTTHFFITKTTFCCSKTLKPEANQSEDTAGGQKSKKAKREANLPKAGLTKLEDIGEGALELPRLKIV